MTRHPKGLSKPTVRRLTYRRLLCRVTVMQKEHSALVLPLQGALSFSAPSAGTGRWNLEGDCGDITCCFPEVVLLSSSPSLPS